ncbi:MAG: hypothetical protein ACSHW0_02390 [Thalassotalea sp.]
MSLQQHEIESVTEYLVEIFGDEYPWRWDEQKNVRLSEFASNKKEKIFALLQSEFDHQWDVKNIRYAPGPLKIKLGALVKLQKNQVVFTRPAKDDKPMLVAIWWPWGHGGTVSLRLTALTDTYHPGEIKHKKDSIFTIIKKLFT